MRLQVIPDATLKLPRNYVVGYFFPAAIFVVASFVLWAFFAEGTTLNMETSDNLGFLVTSIFLSILVASAFLDVFNNVIIKLYEGLWPSRLNPLRLLLLRRRIRQWRQLQNEIERLKKSNQNRDKELAYQLERKFLLDFPPKESSEADILPTRLGNIIAAFEHYPYRRYSIDAVTMWSRLLPLIPNAHKQLMAKAKSNFDFMLNLSFLSYLQSLLVIGYFRFSATSVALAVLFSIMAFGMYRLSFGPAVWWGETIKSAFDLYRTDLLKKLCVDIIGKEVSAEEERDIWQQLGFSMKYDYVPKVQIKVGDTNSDSKQSKRVSKSQPSIRAIADKGRS